MCRNDRRRFQLMLSIHDLQRPGLITATFDIADGECVAVHGQSGSGKTLLLRAIADLDPSSGEVMLDGQAREAMAAPAWRRKVTYVPAEPGWWAETVGQHLPDWDSAAPYFDAFGLPHALKDSPVQRLSTGERQRCALIRALVLDPRVLLLDEPTSGLDPEGVAAVETQVLNHLANGAAVIWVTHDPAQAQRISQRHLVVDHGRVTEATA